MRFGWILSACSTIVIAGCGVTPSHNPVVITDPASPTVTSFKGMVHGGQQPIDLAHVYLMAVGTGGFGTSSTSLLNSNTGASDSVGNYVTTNANGFFSITSGMINSCVGDQVYLYSLGGNTLAQTGGTANPAAGLMAVLGTCGAGNSFTNLPATLQMNELTTVAAAYALAPYATDATHIGADSGAATGLANASLTATNIVSIGTGQAYATTPTPSANGTVPQSEINTLGNILAYCVNTSGPTSSNCTSLFQIATKNGTPTGAQATDTATAAIYIAKNPGANVTALWDFENSSGPFQPSLTTSTPNDWTIAVPYGGGGSGPTAVAIDAAGNVWLTESDTNTLAEFNNQGNLISPSTGYTGGGLSDPNGVAIDQTGNVWVTSLTGGSISEYVPGSGYSLSSPITGGGLNDPWGVAVDASGNVWITDFGGPALSEYVPGTGFNGTGFTGGGLSDPIALSIDNSGNIWVGNHGASSISEFNSSGVPQSPVTVGYTGGGLNEPSSSGIDASGNIWFGNEGNSLLSKYDPATPGFVGTGYSGGGLSLPYTLAVDGAGNIWLADYSASPGSISEFNNSGSPISPGTGYQGTLSSPEGIAIDNSGNVWVTNSGNNDIVEFIGAAAPVVTPLSVALKNHELGTRP
jgi:streptogramin lyase